jgi:pimeloyl-ACP methyl ester carboxylesterase
MNSDVRPPFYKSARGAVILVHGGWHGAWCWEQLIATLDARGIDARAVTLSSCGWEAADLGDLYTDIAIVKDAVAAVDGPVVVCGHSFGGTVISAAADGMPGVRHLVYLAAAMPDAGQSHSECLASHRPPPPWPADGILRPTPTADLRNLFYHDCDEATAEWAIERLAPLQAVSSLTQRIGTPAWRHLPSTYVRCTEDRTAPEAFFIEMAARATYALELPASHSPFLSMPDRVADILAALL